MEYEPARAEVRRHDLAGDDALAVARRTRLHRCQRYDGAQLPPARGEEGGSVSGADALVRARPPGRALAQTTLARRRIHERRDVLGGFSFHAGLLQKAEIAEPVDVAKLPGAKRNVIAVRQTAGHAAAIGQGIAGVPSIAVDVHLDVRHANPEHRAEVFDCPDRMNAVARTATHEERRRHIARDRWRGAIARDGRGAGIDDAHEVGPRRNARQRIAGVAVLRGPTSWAS